MLPFLSSQSRTEVDPLQSRKRASAWFEQLSASDVLTRQQRVVDAFEAMQRSWTQIDRHRVAAILYVDGAFEIEQRRLISWYLENLTTSPRLAARFRQAAGDANQAILNAYQTALNPVCTRAGDGGWKPLVPLFLCRLVHCLGIDAKLRLFNHERWIPARWVELHDVYLRALELSIEGVAASGERVHFSGEGSTIEHEYVYVLLLQQLDTGNLSPAELEWASSRLRTWSADLVFDRITRRSDSFYVDFGSARGLSRRGESIRGDRIGSIDTAPLIAQLDATMALLEEQQRSDDPERRAAAHRHAATLQKLRPALSALRHGDLRRHPRTVVDIAAAVHVGLQNIASRIDVRPAVASAAPRKRVLVGTTDWQQALRYDARDTTRLPAHLRSDEWIDASAIMFATDDAHGDFELAGHDRADDVETIDIPPIVEGRPLGPHGSGTREAPSNDVVTSASDVRWRLKDRSVSGWRMIAPTTAGESLCLHSLAAVRADSAEHWTLTIVRRLHKHGNHVEAGVAVVADRVLAVMLHAKRNASGAMSVVVDGIDVATFGPRFSGLYLIGGAGQEPRVSLRTLIVPTPEYAEGRALVLATGRSNYTIVLRQLIDHSAEWSWAAVQVTEKTPRLP